MEILLLYSYYKPENLSGSRFAEELRCELLNRGHNIQIYTPTPTRGVSDEIRNEYKKKRNETEFNGKLSVHRFPLYREGKNTLSRAVRYIILEFQLLWFGLHDKNCELLLMGSTPPINGLMATFLKKVRKLPYIYTVQDIFPESLANTGIAKENSLLYKIGLWVSDVSYKNANHIFVITEDAKENLIGKGVPKNKISVIYNWVDTDKIKPIDRKENFLFDKYGLDRNKFYVTYAGNMSNSQNVGILVDVAEKFKDKKDIEIVIFGEGTEKEKILNRINDLKLTNIKIFPYEPAENISYVYSLGDISTVLTKAGVGKSAFPSKTLSIIACGTPLIASFDRDSDLCKLIEKEKLGYCAEPENADILCEKILNFYNNKELLKECSINCRNIAKTKFSKEVLVRKKADIIEKYAKI